MTDERLRIHLPPLPMTGGCQCGRVRYVLTAAPLTLYACHCKECQRQSSSAFGQSMRVPVDAFKLTGETATTGRADPAAPPVRGVFCPLCGSRLYHHRPGRDTLNVKAGTLDDTGWIVAVGHLWTRSAQRGFRPPGGALVYDGQPPDYDALIDAFLNAIA